MSPLRILVVGWVVATAWSARGDGLPLAAVRLPPGFHIELYAAAVPGARSLALGEDGTVYVGTRGDKVYALPDRNRDGRADEVITLLRGLDTPNGVAVRDGHLYVAEVGRILRYDAIASHLRNPPPPRIVTASFPKDRSHGWKFIRFGPDGRLYVPVGAPCNICAANPDRYAAIFSLRPDGSDRQVFARGVRNSVGFDWHPGTGQLWFTDNGRDWLGNEIPPDELNQAPRSGLHFGYPHCHGRALPDPAFGRRRDCAEFVPPAQELGPHVAALGMRFYTGKQFPAEFHGQIIIAEHGSWNRVPPIGYRLSLVRLEGDRAVDYRVFADGWLDGVTAWGRPVDVQVMPDGALLVSDDRAGVVYRITYRP